MFWEKGGWVWVDCGGLRVCVVDWRFYWKEIVCWLWSDVSVFLF